MLEPVAGKSRYKSHGQRVVAGQRLTQAASDHRLLLDAIRDGRIDVYQE